MKKTLLILLILLSMASFSFSANYSKKDIDKALTMYQNGNYYDALIKLEKTLDLVNIRDDKYSSVALFMIIKCNYKLQNYDSVMRYSRIFGEYFPTSQYLADIYFIKSQSLVNKNNYNTAILPALEAETLTNDLTFSNNIKKFIIKISSAFISENELLEILSLMKTENQYYFVKLLLIEKYIDNGDFEKAEKTITEVEKKISTTDFFGIAYIKDLKKNLINSNTEEINIGVVLPLTGANSIPGNNILNGIKLALKNYKDKNNSAEINLIILDTESDTKNAVKHTYQLSQMKNCVAVIGPLSSQSAIAMSPICNILKLPLLTPTATENGLANMGKYIFQLSPDKDERGYAIANYSTNNLELENFVTIAPGDQYGRTIVNSFNNTIEQKAGKIIENIWYQGTPKDIRHEFKRIIEVDSLTYNYLNNDSTLIDSLQKLITKINFSTIQTIDSSFLLVNNKSILSINDSSFLSNNNQLLFNTTENSYFIEESNFSISMLNDSSLLSLNDSTFILKNSLLPINTIFNINTIDSLEEYFSYDNPEYKYFRYVDSIKNIITSNPKNDNILLINDKSAIYFAIYPDDIQYIAPQIAKYDFQAQYLGDANWFDIDILNKYKNYIDGIIFISDHLWLEGKKENEQLFKKYKEINGTAPNRIGLYGYDTMLLLLNQIESGAHTREEINNSLSNLNIFTGPIRRIKFTSRKPRVNTAMNVLQFKNNRIHILEEE